MTKDEVAKLYIETTARKLVLRQEAHDIQADLVDQILAYQEEHGAPLLTPAQLLDAAGEAIELSGLPETASEVRSLRAGVEIVASLAEEFGDTPSAAELGRRL